MLTSLCDVDPFTPHRVYRGIHYFLIFALKHRLWVLVRTASLKKMKTVKKNSTENCHFYNCHFYSRENSWCVAWAYFRHGNLTSNMHLICFLIYLLFISPIIL